MSSGVTFKGLNGAPQATLIFVYVDDLLEWLTFAKSGCFVEDVCFNHLFYPDDLSLLSPSAKALQKLTYICTILGLKMTFYLTQDSLYVYFLNQHINLYVVYLCILYR